MEDDEGTAFYAHPTTFAGFPVKDWEPGDPLADPGATIYRLSVSWGEADHEGVRWSDKLAAYLETPGAELSPGIVVGPWGRVSTGDDTSAAVVEALVAARERLPHLTAIYLGDIVSEESEISWIQQSDVSPLLHAYPALEHFRVRGGNGLTLGTLHHAGLRSLTIESGGLPATVVREVAAAQLPALEHLELWLGTEEYGGDSTLEDLAPILSGTLFPRLRYLGLRDSDRADEVAVAVATAPVLQRIRLLDLSLGTLTDEGAAALLHSPAIARLEKLDLHHHFCSDEMMASLLELGIDVDVSEREEAEEDDGDVWRYVAVGE
jgi:hypothetical protein